MLYFGCSNFNVGHYLFEESGQTNYNNSPVGSLDGVYCPKDCDQLEGEASMVEKDGHTILAFWDRSKDTRFGSNAAFIEKGSHSAGEMIRMAKEKFPLIMSRFNFSIVVR